MKLPLPTDKLAGCIWLPRILSKARLLAQGALPEEYVTRFGHATGVDGQFLKHFGLTKADIINLALLSDAEASVAFYKFECVNPDSVQNWNTIAVNLGRSGFPMAERLPIALRTSYAHLVGRHFETVFEVLVADEQ